MRYLLPFLLFIFVFASSCNEDEPGGLDNCDPQNTNNPRAAFPWIDQAIAQDEIPGERGQILCYQLDNRLVFLVDFCLDCNNGFVVYDCNQIEVCRNDQQGNDNCGYFQQNAINEILIWRNF